GPVAAQRDLERRARSRRQVQELLPLLVLAPAVALAVELDRPPALAPVGDRREAIDRRLGGVLPEVRDDRLACRAKREALARRQRAVRRPEVLGEGEERAVWLEEGMRKGVAFVQLDLQRDGIGLEVDQTAARR